MSKKELNLRVAETLWKEHRCNDQTVNDSDYVAILDGDIIAVADNPGDAISALRALDPDPRCGMVVDVRPPEMDVIRREA